MQIEEEIKKEVETKSSEEKESHSHKINWTPTYGRIMKERRNELLQLFVYGQYETLQKKLVLYKISKQDFVDFFKKRDAKSAFMCEVVHQNTNEPLSFLLKNARDALQLLLKADDYSLLKSIMFAELGHEVRNSDNEPRIERLMLLLKIDRTGFSKLLKDNPPFKLTDRMKENFSEALKRLETEKNEKIKAIAADAERKLTTELGLSLS